MSEKVERLVNLTVALLEARRPRTFAELRTGLHAYDQDDPESARRMFERDKDDLRRLGVPVDTRQVGALDAEVGYIIERRDYEVPDIDLTAEEVTALALALRIAGHPRDRLPLVKLAARAPDPADVDLPGVRITVDAHALDRVADALVDRRALRFDYTTAAGHAATRTVDPYAVVQRRGAWYLVGRDHDRDGVRAFRLERATSAPRPVGPPAAFDPPADLAVHAHVAGAADDRVDALVAVDPRFAWDAETHGGRHDGETGDGWPVFRFPRANPLRVLSWALGLGPDGEVLAPPSLRERAADHLRGLTAATGDAT